MAHLWSKFTKCLRPSKGASDPGPLPSPNAVPLSAQCRVTPPLLRRCYHHLAEATRSCLLSSIVRSSPRSFTSPLCATVQNPYFISPRSPERSKVLPLIMNITLITKYFLLRLSIFQCDMLSFIYGNPPVKHDRRKLPGELIAVRYLTKYAHAYNWILFMDFIQNVYRCINYKRRARKAREDRPSPFDSRSQLGLPLLSSWVMNVPNYILKAVLH